MSIYLKTLSHYFLFILIPFFGYAQLSPSKVSERIDEMMQGDQFVGVLPDNPRWSADGKTIFFSKKAALAPYPDWYAQSFENGKLVGEPVKIADNDFSLNPDKYFFYKNTNGDNVSRLKRYQVVEVDGDIYIQNLNSGLNSRITNTVERESNPMFTRQDSAVVYQKGNDLYYFWLHNGSTEQITYFTDKTDRVETYNEAQTWLNQQQEDLLGIVRYQKRDDSLRKNREKPYQLTAIPLSGRYVSSVQVSDNGRFVIYILGKYDSKGTEVPNYINDSGYTENLRARAKVGNSSADFTLHVYDRFAKTNRKIRVENLPNIKKNAPFYAEYGKELERETPKNIWIHQVIWSPNKTKGVLVLRSDDSKDRWIAQLDPTSLQLQLIDHQHDPAWIGGEGISGWHASTGTLGWIDQNTVFYQSEKTGYSHLYTHDVVSNTKKQLTKGDYEVVDVMLSEDRKNFYIRANKENPHEYHIYKVNAQMGKMDKITSQKGFYEDAVLSPDEKYWVARYSYSNKPWELVLFENKANASQQRITNSTTKEFEKKTWYDPQIISFKTPDGAEVPARIYKPEEGKKNNAAVMFVHGAGYLQNVHYGWSTYFREYMFHNLLREQGYTVIDIDYRGSKGYGRDWRTAIYRHMGNKELIDYVAGAEYLIKNHGIEKNKIGIYGGSYGGFMTLMAMFNAPKTFRAGAALRSVTDWAHYNHPYTANILNTPVEDSLAYVRSSPIYFAEGLEGDLLICHGMVDTNVQFQDVVRLAQRLIELRKENWELAVYPIEGHGFMHPTSWADEYKRIYELFDRTIGQNND